MGEVNKMKVILITGKARVGKDTFARRIKEVEESNGKKVFIMSFADSLKSFCKRNFGYKGIKDNTDRKILQETGDLFRSVVPTFFVDMVNFTINACAKLEYDYFIVPDVRFDNEVTGIKWNDKEVIKIERTFDNGLGECAKHKSESGISRELIDAVVDFDRNVVCADCNVISFENGSKIFSPSFDTKRYYDYLDGYWFEKDKKENK